MYCNAFFSLLMLVPYSLVFLGHQIDRSSIWVGAIEGMKLLQIRPPLTKKKKRLLTIFVDCGKAEISAK
jgi:hypothetical protein